MFQIPGFVFLMSISEKLIDSTKHREQIIKQMDHYMQQTSLKLKMRKIKDL
jgi:uncharacterized protein YjbK